MSKHSATKTLVAFSCDTEKLLRVASENGSLVSPDRGHTGRRPITGPHADVADTAFGSRVARGLFHSRSRRQIKNHSWEVVQYWDTGILGYWDTGILKYSTVTSVGRHLGRRALLAGGSRRLLMLVCPTVRSSRSAANRASSNWRVNSSSVHQLDSSGPGAPVPQRIPTPLISRLGRAMRGDRRTRHQSYRATEYD